MRSSHRPTRRCNRSSTSRARRYIRGPTPMHGIALRRNQREALTGLLWISPWLIGFVLFTAGPMLFSLGTSFTRFTLGKTAQFAGFENYIRAFTNDPLFWPSLGRTVAF